MIVYINKSLSIYKNSKFSCMNSICHFIENQLTRDLSRSTLTVFFWSMRASLHSYRSHLLFSLNWGLRYLKDKLINYLLTLESFWGTNWDDISATRRKEKNLQKAPLQTHTSLCSLLSCLKATDPVKERTINTSKCSQTCSWFNSIDKLKKCE